MAWRICKVAASLPERPPARNWLKKDFAMISLRYQEIFTLSYVTGRSVGIGAYLNRLGQRVIQSVDGPLVLTGYSALNKLLGKNAAWQGNEGLNVEMTIQGCSPRASTFDSLEFECILSW